MSCKGFLKMYIIYQEYELKRIPYKRELFDLYVFQKSPHSMLLFWRYSKICNSTPIQIGQFMHPTSLFYWQWSKCIVFMLMPCATKRVKLSMLHGMKDKGSYLMYTLPPLYKCTHVKRKKIVAGNY